MCLYSKGICTEFYINLNSGKQTYPWGIKVNGKVFLKELIFEARSEWWEQFIKVKREKTSIGLGQKVCLGFSVIAYKKKKLQWTYCSANISDIWTFQVRESMMGFRHWSMTF